MGLRVLDICSYLLDLASSPDMGSPDFGNHATGQARASRRGASIPSGQRQPGDDLPDHVVDGDGAEVARVVTAGTVTLHKDPPGRHHVGPTVHPLTGQRRDPF